MDNIQTVELKSYVNKRSKREVVMTLDHDSLWQEDSFELKADIVKERFDNEKNVPIYFDFEKTRRAGEILTDIILEDHSKIPYWYLIESEDYSVFDNISDDFKNAKNRSFTLNKHRGKTLETHIAQQRGLIKITEIHWIRDKRLMKIKYQSYRLGAEKAPDDPMQKTMFEEEGFGGGPTMDEIQSYAFEKNEITFTTLEDTHNNKGIFSPFGPQIEECYKMINEEMIYLWKKSIHLKHELALEIDSFGCVEKED